MEWNRRERVLGAIAFDFQKEPKSKKSPLFCRGIHFKYALGLPRPATHSSRSPGEAEGHVALVSPKPCEQNSSNKHLLTRFE